MNLPYHNTTHNTTLYISPQYEYRNNSDIPISMHNFGAYEYGVIRCHHTLKKTPFNK